MPSWLAAAGHTPVHMSAHPYLVHLDRLDLLDRVALWTIVVLLFGAQIVAVVWHAVGVLSPAAAARRRRRRSLGERMARARGAHVERRAPGFQWHADDHFDFVMRTQAALDAAVPPADPPADPDAPVD